MKKQFKYKLRRVIFAYIPFILMWDGMFIYYLVKQKGDETMKTEIKLICGNKTEGSCNLVKKENVLEEISKVLKEHCVEKIDITYK